MTMKRPVPPDMIALPDPPTDNETAIWRNLCLLMDHQKAMATYIRSLEVEAKKDGSTDLSGTVNSGDATTDDVIEAIRTALITNNLGTG